MPLFQNYNMSSEGDDRLSREQEQEDFYDCQESLETPDQRREEEEGGGHQDTSTDELNDKGLQKEQKLPEETRENKNGLQEEEHIERLQWETPTERLQEDEEHIDRLVQDTQKDGLQQDPDSEFGAEEVDFDDSYLSEQEKDLTEEEKEVTINLASLLHVRSFWFFKAPILLQSRRQQSLTLKEKGNGQFKNGGWWRPRQCDWFRQTEPV